MKIIYLVENQFGQPRTKTIIPIFAGRGKVISPAAFKPGVLKKAF
jgi:hypothetical protein